MTNLLASLQVALVVNSATLRTDDRVLEVETTTRLVLAVNSSRMEIVVARARKSFPRDLSFTAPNQDCVE